MAKRPSFLDLPFAEAIAYFSGKVALPTEKGDRIPDEVHDHAFVVSGLARADLLESIKWLIGQAIEEGNSLETFESQFNRLVGRKGWQPGGDRIKKIYSTNIRRSFGAGRYKQMTDPDILNKRSYWMWQHRTPDPEFGGQPREEHKALGGKVFDAKEKFWNKAYPPCFPKGTLVATPTGWQAIETIKPGESVIGGSGQVKSVAAVHITPYQGEVVRITADDGGIISSGVATPNHRILTMRGWIKAESLQVEDKLIQIRQATVLDQTIKNVDDLNTSASNLDVSIPQQRESTRCETLDTKVKFGDIEVNPTVGNPVIVDDIKSQIFQVANEKSFNLGRTSFSGWMALRKSLIVPLLALYRFLLYFWSEKGRANLEFFTHQSYRWAVFFCFTFSSIFSRSVLFCVNLFHNLAANLLPFRVFPPLVIDGLGAISTFDSAIFHHFKYGAVSHGKTATQISDRHILIPVEPFEGFTSGAPLDSFDSLDSFIAWSNVHTVVKSVKNITRQSYSGSVYNLTVEEDQTYCIPLSVVHNCAWGCRCSAFSLSERQMKAMGKKVEKPPKPEAIADPGFRHAPGSSNVEERSQILKDGLQRLSPELRTKVEADFKKRKLI